MWFVVCNTTSKKEHAILTTLYLAGAKTPACWEFEFIPKRKVVTFEIIFNLEKFGKF
jgi:hypothetical protein